MTAAPRRREQEPMPLERAPDAPPGARLRVDRLLPVLVAFVTLLVAVSAIGAWPVGVFQDDGIYTILGKGLAHGEGYRYLNLPGAPNATHYPPGFPALLALLWKLSPRFPANVALFTFTNAALLALAAVGAYYFGKSRFGLRSAHAALLAVATVAGVPTLIFGVSVLSEPMFMALLIPSLLLAERAAASGERRDALIAGLSAGLLAMVRTSGQFVVPALVLILLVRRRWSAAAIALAAGALFLVPWQLWVGAHGGEIPRLLVGKYGPYTPWLTEAVRADGVSFLVGVVAKNLRELEGMAWAMFAGVEPGGAPPLLPIRVMISGALLLFLILGCVRVARRIPVTLLFVAAYLALVVIWPFEPTRFVWVLLPVIGLLAVAGVQRVIIWRPRSRYALWTRAATLVLPILLTAGYATYNLRGIKQKWWDATPRAAAERATNLVEWAREATHPGDLLATDDDALVHLYTGRRTIPVGTFTPQEYLKEQTYAFATIQLGNILALYHPRYVMCSTSYCVRSVQGLMRGGTKLRLVAVVKRGAIFEPVAAEERGEPPPITSGGSALP